MSRALDPVACTRCRRVVAVDDPARPEHLDSRMFRPSNPRPVLHGGAVWWTVEADYHQPGTVSALLCRPCIDELSDWLYQPRTVTRSHRSDRAPLARYRVGPCFVA